MNRTPLAALTLAAALPASLLGSQATPTPTSNRLPQFENSAVKVWRSTILPNQPLALHHHDHPRVIVALTDGTLDLVTSTGAHDLHHWQAGHAYWLPAMPPNTQHADINPGPQPMQVMVIELEKEN